MRGIAMNELTAMLYDVTDSYYDFVIGVSAYAKKSPTRTDAVKGFICNHPDALSSDIIEFVSNQPDFYDDAEKILGVAPDKKMA